MIRLCNDYQTLIMKLGHYIYLTTSCVCHKEANYIGKTNYQHVLYLIDGNTDVSTIVVSILAMIEL